MATTKPIPLGTMVGLNNRLEPEDLAFIQANKAPATYLQAAENIDLLKSGRARRRKGFIQRSTDPAHSLWNDHAGAFGVVNNALQSLTLEGDTLAGATVLAGLPPAPVSYSRGADSDLYWSNGFSMRRVRASDGTDRPLAPPTPTLTPAGPTATAGALRAGRYLVATTMVTVDGESPATDVIALDLPDNSCIELSATLPVCVYVSGCNGDILTLQAEGTDITIITVNANGRPCQTLNRQLMPPGQIVRHFNGRLLVASGNILYMSDPYNYGLIRMSRGYIPFPARIDMLEIVETVLYIAAGDQTWRITADLDSGLQDCLPYGALPLSSFRSPREKAVYWQTPRGLVKADENGQIHNLQDEVLAMGDASVGATLYREQNGMRQVITTRQGVQQSVAIATSYMDAEIIRKGTVL